MAAGTRRRMAAVLAVLCGVPAAGMVPSAGLVLSPPASPWVSQFAALDAACCRPSAFRGFVGQPRRACRLRRVLTAAAGLSDRSAGCDPQTPQLAPSGTYVPDDVEAARELLLPRQKTRPSDVELEAAVRGILKANPSASARSTHQLVVEELNGAQGRKMFVSWLYALPPSAAVK